VVRLHASHESSSPNENVLADHREENPVDQLMTDELPPWLAALCEVLS